jgi:hypothetical protein
MIALYAGAVLRVIYTNWRHETAERHIRVISAPAWTTTEWHPEPQWFIQVFDFDRGAMRMFALKDMKPAPSQN